jgi:glycosyltransferase involved in cell wall biosynthesis
MNLPFVSCICPTYNRRKFLPYLLYMFNYQTYPSNRRELIILDDSPETNKDIIDKYNKDNNIRYIYLNEKLPLGKKRNLINQYAKEKGEYIICFDDDDFYPPEKISYTIRKMLGTKSIISGTSEIYIYFSDLKKLYRFNKLSNNHATNGTLCYHKNYLTNHKYEDNAQFAEEKVFLDQYQNPILQLDPLKCIICIAHNFNTFNKKNCMNLLHPLNIKLKSIVKDKFLLDFYNTLE